MSVFQNFFFEIWSIIYFWLFNLIIRVPLNPILDKDGMLPKTFARKQNFKKN